MAGVGELTDRMGIQGFGGDAPFVGLGRLRKGKRPRLRRPRGGDVPEPRLGRLGETPSAAKLGTPTAHEAYEANLARLREKPKAVTRGPDLEPRKANADPRLIEAVRQERAANTDLSPGSFNSNVAAVRVRIDGQEHILTASNSAYNLHSEEWLEDQMKFIGDEITLRSANRRNPKVEVLEWFSEREPCNGRCSTLLRTAYPDAKVSYLIPDPWAHLQSAGKTGVWDVKALMGKTAEALQRAWLGGG
jgi:hypothetical protein